MRSASEALATDVAVRRKAPKAATCSLQFWSSLRWGLAVAQLKAEKRRSGSLSQGQNTMLQLFKQIRAVPCGHSVAVSLHFVQLPSKFAFHGCVPSKKSARCDRKMRKTPTPPPPHPPSPPDAEQRPGRPQRFCNSSLQNRCEHLGLRKSRQHNQSVGS